MIDALIAGKIHGTPTERTGKSGKPFALAKIRTTTINGESQFVSVIAFDDGPMAALLGLTEGDSVAVTGPLKVGTWQDKDGHYRPTLDIVAQQVLTMYQVRQKSAQTQGQPMHPRNGLLGNHALPDRGDDDRGLDDGSIPF